MRLPNYLWAILAKRGIRDLFFGLVLLPYFFLSSVVSGKMLGSMLRNDATVKMITPVVSEDIPQVLAQETSITRTPTSVPKVAAAQIDVNPSPKLETSPTPVFTPVPVLTRDSYIIAIIGDSMVDTMGEHLNYLDASLKRRYPQLKFALFNYGTGAQNVEEGVARLPKPFSYKTRQFQPLSELRPDILVVASFAYNPFFPYDRNKHWLTLAGLIAQAKQIAEKVYVLAEIAPLKSGFGKGPGGVNWVDNIANEHAQKIVEQLENAVGLAQTLEVPVINAFELSKLAGERFGKPQYVNSSDGIHPSVAGHQLMADLIAESLQRE